MQHAAVDARQSSAATGQAKADPVTEIGDYYERRVSVFWPEIMDDFDPADEILAQFNTQPTLDRFKTAFTEFRARGAYGEGGIKYRLENIDVQGDVAEVLICTDDAIDVFDRTGINISPARTNFEYRRHVLLRSADGVWQMSEMHVLYDPNDTRFRWECAL